MANYMAMIWRNCLERGSQEFSKCPVRYKNQVRILLKQDVKDQIIRVEDYEKITGEKYEDESANASANTASSSTTSTTSTDTTTK
jgi:hypothetical protein